MEELLLNSKQIKSINDRLDALIRLVALSLPDTVSDDTRIDVLTQLGFQSNEIGRMLGMTGNAVRVRQFRIRKKGKDSPKSNESQANQTPESENNGKEETDHTTGT